MATANQKYIIDTHTHKRNESKHITKDNHQITREQKKKGKKSPRKGNSKQLTQGQ